MQLASAPVLQEYEFTWIKEFLYQQIGIVLNDTKKSMVVGRLEKRLRYYGLSSYRDYFNLIHLPANAAELTIMLDLLTTNETYFFREPIHFEFLKNHILHQHELSLPMRIWSAASSSGEEAYSIAMLLSEHRRVGAWEIIGTDISSRILQKAKRGLYPYSSLEKIPKPLVKKYCLKGKGEFEDTILIDPVLRKKIQFMKLNLIKPLPVAQLGKFNVVFLRNVMIYFDIQTKERLLEQVSNFLLPGGFLFTSHSESLSGIKNNLKLIQPSIYQKPILHDKT